MDPIFSAFGVPATVTRPAPDDTPIETTVIWSPPDTVESPGGAVFQRADQRRVLTVRRDEVPTVPRGTQVVAAERDGDDIQHWRVDGPMRADADLIQVIVVPDPEGS